VQPHRRKSTSRNVRKEKEKTAGIVNRSRGPLVSKKYGRASKREKLVRSKAFLLKDLSEKEKGGCPFAEGRVEGGPVGEGAATGKGGGGGETRE